ncbi:MAG: transcription antitermination factor NusB [Candidatus Cloacimonadota bacterium]|nr:MAG: transcription antitermination factor NusB [Candidatus Cloacimonadota bacterium]PIE81415.1 MAG: transcription antitermination factor NusB [Candidatus Delongbacteria bacterium]
MITRRKTREVVLSIIYTMEYYDFDLKDFYNDPVEYWRWFEESCTETPWDEIVDTLSSAYDEILLERLNKEEKIVLKVSGMDEELSLSLSTLIEEKKKDYFYSFADKISENIPVEEISFGELTKEELVKVNENLEYVKEFIGFYNTNKKSIDEEILNRLDNWDFNRLTLMDKLLLRLAVVEILYMPKIPPKVSINEVIDISKKFSTPKSGNFINGILNNLLHNMKNEDSNSI